MRSGMDKTMRTVFYIWIFLTLAAFAGCSDDEPSGGADPGGDMAAVELSVAGEPVQVTRSNLTPLMSTIDNVTILVFDASNNLIAGKNLDYASGERLYLRKGDYQIFAVANLDDSNCPNGEASTYLNDVSTTAGLAGKYVLASSQTLQELGKMIMCSGIEPLTISSTAPATITLRRLQTKIDLNIYNLSDASGNIQSGLSLHSYYTNNLPLSSFLVERAVPDYPRTLADPSSGYGNIPTVNFSTIPSSVVEPSPGVFYLKQSVEIYCFENRGGSATSPMSSEYDRKKYAPEFALQISLLGYVSNKVLDTFILPGKGRDSETPPDTWIDNFDVDRNCIYHVNVVINNTADISMDSRREYLGLTLCGDLDSPSNGTWGDY